MYWPEPEGYFEAYRPIFEELGVTDLVELYVEDRGQAFDEAKLALLEGAAGIYFTGGDQLRITSQIGDSILFQCMHDLYQRGGTIVGTSAGASAMSETMLIGGPGDQSARLKDIAMAPGLGFLPGFVIDSHFAQRGRVGRLVGAVAQNPRNLGLGIDEDTAVIVEKGRFTVIGSGAVYLLDGTQIPYSSLSEKRMDKILSVYDVRLSVMAAGRQFDLTERRAILPQNADE